MCLAVICFIGFRAVGYGQCRDFHFLVDEMGLVERLLDGAVVAELISGCIK